MLAEARRPPVLALVASLLLVAALHAPAATFASPPGRSLLILPFEAVDLERGEQWFGEGVAQLLSLALVHHSAVMLVEPARVRRLGPPGMWGEPVIREAARTLRADSALYGEVKRVAGDLTLVPLYLDTKAASAQARSLEPLTIGEGRLLEGLRPLPLAYLRALKVAVSEAEATKIEQAARPTNSLRAFEAFVMGRRAMLLGTQAGNEAAAELLGKAVELDPAFVGAQYSLGLVHLALGNRWKAAAQFRASTQLDPSYPEPYKSLGDLFLAAPRRLFDQAVEAYQKALELRPFYADAYVGLGDAKAAQGDVDRAIGSYQQALVYDPGNPKVHMSLGKIYYAEKGLYYESVESYKRAIELDPQFLEARMGLGEVFEDKGLYQDAVREYRKVVELDSRHTGALYNLALVYEKLDPRAAVAQWERYIEVAALLPSEKDWVDVARQHLRKLRIQLERGQ